MKFYSIFSIVLFVVICPMSLSAQKKVIVDEDYRTATINTLKDLIINHYVYEEVGRKTAKYLDEELKAGRFDQIADIVSLANALTETVQAVNKDKHMRIHQIRAREAAVHTPERLAEDLLYRYNYRRRVIAGFREARKIDGNIGYLDLRGFAGVDWGAPVADRYMYLLGTSDAIIVDLRKNGGGDPSMVQYLCSYFFGEKVHLNSLYYREGDITEDYWTLDEVGGVKLPDVPLYVLTSGRTFSGAEEFAYNMQTRKRATLVGETTGGGANPGDIMQINEQLEVFLPTGAAVNPVTKTNWEGVGVVPEVKVAADDALDKAIELATVAAEEYRNSKQEEKGKLLKNLQAALESFESGGSDKAVFQQLKSCIKEGLLKESDINMMGYEYLNGLKKSTAGEVILKANTQFFPESANTYDSYGEALAANGKYKAAIENYEKAVKVAAEKEDGNLEMYKRNLAKVKEQALQNKGR